MQKAIGIECKGEFRKKIYMKMWGYKQDGRQQILPECQRNKQINRCRISHCICGYGEERSFHSSREKMLEISWEVFHNHNHNCFRFLFKGSKNPRSREGKRCCGRFQFALYASCIPHSNGFCLVIYLNHMFFCRSFLLKE